MQPDVLSWCMEAGGKALLSVGSGDGSQQQAIVAQGVRNLQVTFHDSKIQLLKKYPHATATMEYLKENCFCAPRFEIDAAKLHECYAENSFDLVMFTHPHTGVPNTDPTNVSSNQRLLCDFLNSAYRILKPDGEIQITLKNGDHYDKWGLPALLEKCAGLKLRSKGTFDASKFPGYKHRLTVGTSGPLQEVPSKKGSTVYIFDRTERRHLTVTTSLRRRRLLRIYCLPVIQAWSDEEARARLVELLGASAQPQDVLEIRRNYEEPIPDTRQLNRILYDMERHKIVQRFAPLLERNKKPRWNLHLLDGEAA